MFCNACGKAIASQSAFCSHCGNKLPDFASEEKKDPTASQQHCGNEPSQTKVVNFPPKVGALLSSENKVGFFARYNEKSNLPAWIFRETFSGKADNFCEIHVTESYIVILPTEARTLGSKILLGSAAIAAASLGPLAIVPAITLALAGNKYEQHQGKKNPDGYESWLKMFAEGNAIWITRDDCYHHDVQKKVALFFVECGWWGLQGTFQHADGPLDLAIVLYGMPAGKWANNFGRGNIKANRQADYKTKAEALRSIGNYSEPSIPNDSKIMNLDF